VARKATPTFYRHKLVLRGEGPFPADLLRYAALVPATGADANSLDHRPRRDLIFHRYSQEAASVLDAHTSARVASFGWLIVSTEPAA